VAKTVLIVEDDGAVAQLLGDVLEAEGFQVQVEADGERGLRAFESKAVDLVITDLVLPKLEGAELIERLRELPGGRDVPIIVISGVSPSPELRRELVEKHRVRELLDEPLDVDRMIDLLHDVFSSAYPEPKSTPTGEHRLLPELKRAVDGSSRGTLLDVPDKGDLETVPFARVLGKLFRTRATGALMLRKASVKKIVYLREGIPIFVKSNLLSECLGRIMVQERLISQEECDESLKKKKKEKGRQGEILVQMGSISQHNLDFALELQMQTKLFDMFSWLEGRYQFNDRGDYSATQVALPMAPVALIYEGASRAMSNERIARELARLADTKVVPSGDPTFRYQTLQLDPRADRLVDKIDGSRSVGELLDAAELDRADAALLLYALAVTGLLQSAEKGLPSAELISLSEADVESLSTGEINAIAELARVGEEPEPDSNWENLEALFDASAQEALDPVTEPPRPLPARIEARWSEPRPALFDVDDDVEEPLEGATEEAFSYDTSDAFQSDPALAEQQVPRAMTLPREPRWEPKLPPPPPPDSMNDSSDDTPLSDELRRQVRERLEAHVNRLAEARVSERPRPAAPITKKLPTRPSAASTYRMRAAPRDLEKDRRLESDLTERLQLMEGLTYYELLEVADDARVEIIRTAYHALARKHDPERVVGQSTSRIVHQKAEQIYLLLTRALNTLTNETARAEYDRRVGSSQVKEADLIAADTAFELGSAAASRGDWRAARELFERAVRLDREEGVYLAHLGWSIHQGDGGDDKALDLLARAAEKSPRSEEVHLFTAQIQEKAGRKAEAIAAYQRALGCNPDCVRALEALKVLDPPSHKRSGLLSRLNLS
jgi:CheY-like chemotaxis protein